MKKIFYFHIPKTAGTSLINVFDSHCERTMHHIESEVPDMDRELMKTYDIVSGHVTFSKISDELDLSDWLTISTFRSPYEHVISHLSWVRKLADEGQEQRFEQHTDIIKNISLYMKELDLGKPRNIEKLIEYLDSVSVNYFHNTQTLYMDENKSLNQAIDNMKKLDIIGLTESMDSFYQRLYSLMSWPQNDFNRKVLNRNSNKYGLDVNNEAHREALYPLVNIDLLLYEDAMKLDRYQKDHYRVEPPVKLKKKRWFIF